ncbi:MAG: DMT family transporter [Candidatus Roizmanbacteria bacterium]|nr:DMT family transporter [Candidatus Roizmanbacteria bacterium]
MNPVVALIITNLIWGAASPIFKLALENIPPFTLAFIRFFFAGTLYLLFVIKKWKALTKKQFLYICLGAFFGITINISFYFLALPKTNSINAPIIASAQPIFLYLISIFYLKEHQHKNVLYGMIVSFIGVLIIIFSPIVMNGSISIEQKNTELIGNLFLVVATLGAIGQAITHKKILKEVGVLQVIFISFLFGALSFFPLAMLELRTWSFALLDWRGWFGILFGVILSSALAYGLFIYGISKIDAQEIGLFSYIDPVIAVLLAIPLLGEYPNIFFFIGSFLVFAGIFFAEERLNWHPFHRIKR